MKKILTGILILAFTSPGALCAGGSRVMIRWGAVVAPLIS